MTPDMTAGLMSLAGSPPGVIAPGRPATGPPGLETLCPSLFASLLTQNGAPVLLASSQPAHLLPNATIADPKLAADPKPTFNSLKTMDTLPNLPLPSLGKVKEKASELPLHKAKADDKAKANDKALAVDKVYTRAPKSDPQPLSMALSQIISQLPVVSQVPVLVTGQQSLAPRQSLVPNLPVPSVPVSNVAVLPASSAAPFALVTATPLPAAPNTVALNTVTLNTVTLTPGLVGTALSVQNTRHEAVTSLPSVGLVLPRTFTLAAPSALAAASPDSTAPISALPIIGQPSGHLAAPVTPSLVSAVPDAKPGENAPADAAPLKSAQPSGLAPAIPSPKPELSAPLFAAMPFTVPEGSASALPITPHELLTASAPNTSLPVVAASTLLQPPVGVPSAALPKLTLEKAAGKSLGTALKPLAKSADNNTRTARVETPLAAVAAKQMGWTISSGHSALKPDPAAAEARETSVLPETPAPLGTQAQAQAIQAAPLESKLLSAADRTEMTGQVADAVSAMPLPAKPGGVQHMSLQLHPKDWGQLQVSVSVIPSTQAGAAKTVTAHIVAETPQIKAALQSQTGALHQALRASGLHLEHLTVTVKQVDAKLPEVRPSAESASAGFSSRQGQPEAGINQAQPGQTAQAGQSSGFAASGFAASGGSGQSGQQGEPQPGLPAAPTEPDLEDPPFSYVMRPVSGRIDTLA